MDTLLTPLLQSPKLPHYVRELSDYLQAEKEKREAFYHDLRDDVKAEFINGEVVVHSPARLKHSLVVENLGDVFKAFVRKNKLGIIVREKALVRLIRSDFEPDICFFANEKSNQFNGETMFYPAPDFVVEVLSKSTEKNDRGIKKEDYGLNGVQEYWIINPDKKEVEQYVLTDKQYELKSKTDHGTVRCEVLKGLEIPLDAIFDEEANEKFLDTI